MHLIHPFTTGKYAFKSLHRLFSPNMEVIKLNARSRDAAESALNLYLDQCKNSTMRASQRALVVDGKTLIYILDKRANIQHLFLNLTKMCSSVLACRATPLQVAFNIRKILKVIFCSVSESVSGADSEGAAGSAHTRHRGRGQ